jgi:ribosomal protein S26
VIPVPIPYAARYTATAHGSVPKFVRCEQCGQEYVYTLGATAQGAATSLLFLDDAGADARSRAAAEAAVAAALRGRCGVVPCPSCGHVQPDMVAVARARRYGWMRRANLPAFLAFAALFPTATVLTQYGQPGGPAAMRLAARFCWAGAVTALVAPIVLPVTRRVLAGRYNPNAEPLEARKARGCEYAVTKEVYLAGAGRGGAEPDAAPDRGLHSESE